MNSTLPKTNAESITPAVHLEFIQNQLENPGPDTPEQVEQYHRYLFLHQHAPEWERHRQEVKIHQDKLSFLESQLQEIQLRLSERPKLVAARVDGAEDINPNAP